MRPSIVKLGIKIIPITIANADPSLTPIKVGSAKSFLYLIAL